MKDAGPAWMSIGHGSGQNRAKDAAKEALSSPLLDVSIEGAKGVLFNVAGGPNLSLSRLTMLPRSSARPLTRMPTSSSVLSSTPIWATMSD